MRILMIPVGSGGDVHPPVRACRSVASRFVGIDPVAQTCDRIEAAA